MHRKDSGRAEGSMGNTELSRRKFLFAAAVSAGGVSTRGFPMIARAASLIADKGQSKGPVEEIAREEALTFGVRPAVRVDQVVAQ